MRSALVVIGLAVPILVNAQNLIHNPGFEVGALIPVGENQVAAAPPWNSNCARYWLSHYPEGKLGSPDLFDSRSSNCLYQIPTNKWGTRPPRAGGLRYVGFAGHTNIYGPAYFGESVEGTLMAPLTVGSYEVSFWISGVDGYRSGCNEPFTSHAINPHTKIEVMLRKGNDCTTGKKRLRQPGP